jgi:copper chaperone CopZ
MPEFHISDMTCSSCFKASIATVEALAEAMRDTGFTLAND